MNMSQRFGKTIKEWAIFLGRLLLLTLLYMLVWVPIENLGPRRAMPYVVISMVVYLIVFTIIMISFFRRLKLAHSPPEYREAREHGLPATARVLDIKWTRWRSRRNDASLTLPARPTKFEYQMRLLVSRPGETEYETTIAEFLLSDEVPKKGDTIAVKIHPQRPEVIVWAPDETS